MTRRPLIVQCVAGCPVQRPPRAGAARTGPSAIARADSLSDWQSAIDALRGLLSCSTRAGTPASPGFTAPEHVGWRGALGCVRDHLAHQDISVLGLLRITEHQEVPEPEFFIAESQT